MENKQPITEEMKVHEQWYEQAREATPDTLAGFIDGLMNDYRHDYGTVCHAYAAAAIATMWSMDRGPQGGITGFQASAIMWLVVRNWMSYKGPLKLVKYEDMLYPQYGEKFDKVIDAEIFKELQEMAESNIANRDRAHPDVVAHWERIVAGEVPFGYRIKQ